MNYLIDKDPTLPSMGAIIGCIWLITAIIVGIILMQPNVKPWINSVSYPLNGAILHSDYVPGEIK